MQILALVWWIHVRIAQLKNELKSKKYKGTKACVCIFIFVNILQDLLLVHLRRVMKLSW
jgi:hypothetical protein